MPWRPGRRDAERVLEQPYEDVPEHLEHALQSWVMGYLQDATALFTIGVSLRVRMPDPRVGSTAHNNAVSAMQGWIEADDGRLLDLVEELLRTYGWNGGAAERLDATLRLGNSAYRVNDDFNGLEMRISPEVKQQVQSVVSNAAGSAGAHLAAAWNEAYGREHDPVKSYSEAIKAVEAAAAPVISPKNLKATLGTMLGDVRSAPAKWVHDIPPGDMASVELMMRILWEGQTSRHGGLAPTVPETPEAAKAAVHLAATLVQWFVGGAIRAV